MPKTLIKLKDGISVNPRYVTCIERGHRERTGDVYTRVWVVKDSGYGTGSYEFSGDRVDEFTALINQEDPSIRAQ